MEKIAEAEYRRALLLVQSHSGVINGLLRRIDQLQGRPILAEHIERLGWEVVLYRAMRADAQQTVRAWRAQCRAQRKAAKAARAAARAEAGVRSQAHRTAAKRAWRHARKAALVAMIAAQ